MKGRRILSLMAAFVLAMVTIAAVPGGAIPAHADSGDAALQMGASALSKSVNSTGAQVLKYGGLNWYVIGYGDGSATLLARINTGITKYDSNANSNAYSTSTLRTKVDAIADAFTAQEQGAVSERALTGGNPPLDVEGHNENDISGDSVNALLWPLSVAEANNVNGDLRKADPEHLGWESNYWWLRSPGYNAYYSAFVWGNGNVNVNGYYVDYKAELGVRPAFYLNLSSVLFTSAAAGGKSSGTAGADALTDIGSNTGNEWKVTLKGLAPEFSVSYCAGSYNSETGAVTVKYTGAAGNYISAIVTDSTGGTIKKYGRIEARTGTDGEVTINTSGKMAEGDKLYVFCEHYKGDNETDQASELKEITIPPEHSWEWITDKEATCGEAGTKHEECSVCHAKQNEGTEIEPTGHDWEFKDFTWTGNETDGYTAAVANYVCKNDSSHTTTAEARISEAVTATCTEGGKTAYTATVSEDVSPDKAEHKESKEAKATGPTGHDWEFKDFTWTGNETDGYTAAVANYVCKNDSSHTTTAEANISEDVTDATCTEGGKTAYTATVSEDVSPDKAEHKESKDAKATDPLGHDWNEPVYTWTEDNSGVTAERVCKRDSKHVETETVKTTEKTTKEPTYDAAGEKEFIAKFENTDFETQTKTAEIPALEKGIYTITSGANGSWTKGTDKTLQFTVKRTKEDETAFGHFTGILVDNKAVLENDASGKANFTAKSGSVIIDLQSTYLETLAVGKHTLNVQFDDGAPAQAEFTVQAKAAPTRTPTAAPTRTPVKSNGTLAKTGDNNPTSLWMALVAASLGGLILVFVVRRRMIR